MAISQAKFNPLNRLYFLLLHIKFEYKKRSQVTAIGRTQCPTDTQAQFSLLTFYKARPLCPLADKKPNRKLNAPFEPIFYFKSTRRRRRRRSSHQRGVGKKRFQFGKMKGGGGGCCKSGLRSRAAACIFSCARESMDRVSRARLSFCMICPKAQNKKQTHGKWGTEPKAISR
jgi:hypothetical protein